MSTEASVSGVLTDQPGPQGHPKLQMFCWAGKLHKGTGENKLMNAFSWWTVSKLERRWTTREKIIFPRKVALFLKIISYFSITVDIEYQFQGYTPVIRHYKTY